MNWGTVLVGAVVLVIIGLAIWKLYRDKKAGKTCASCPSKGSCPGGCN